MDWRNDSYFDNEESLNDSINGSQSLNLTISDINYLEKLYLYTIPPMILLCAISVSINLVIVCSLYWMRRPITPTLHMSLSLAGADLYTSILLGVGLVLNSLFPKVLRINPDTCHQLFVEALRMGGMFTTLGHLLALAGNHYIGIRKPLHYISWMTKRNIHITLFLLWTVPCCSLLIYFNTLDNDGFSAKEGCNAEFITKKKFRSICSYWFLFCLFIMTAIYSHIYLLVRRHQANRNRFRRVGSTYTRNHQLNEQHQAQAKNEKAFKTTLLIVGSVLLGWLPSVSYFYLVCEDCYFPLNWAPPEYIFKITAMNNTLLILKTGLNSYIYAARMHEIKMAINKMWKGISMACCNTGDNTNTEDLRHISQTSSRRSRRTLICHVRSIRSDNAAGNDHSTAQL